MIKLNTDIEIKGDSTRVTLVGPFGGNEYKLKVTSKDRLTVYTFVGEARAMTRYLDALRLLVGTIDIDPKDEWHKTFLTSL